MSISPALQFRDSGQTLSGQHQQSRGGGGGEGGVVKKHSFKRNCKSRHSRSFTVLEAKTLQLHTDFALSCAIFARSVAYFSVSQL